MAAWNLRQASELCARTAERQQAVWNRLRNTLRLTEREVRSWSKVADGLRNAPPYPEGAVVEQFAGFFKLKPFRIRQHSAAGLPILPAKMSFAPTQLIKQADVLLLMYLLPDAFSDAQVAQNYRCYEPRAVHQSSLSLPIHAIMALRAGDIAKALKLYRASAAADLEDIHGNTGHGMHIACCGGNWQALVHGFGGFSVRDGTPCFDPKLPGAWRALNYTVRWGRGALRVRAGHQGMRLRLEGRESITVRVYGKTRTLQPAKSRSFMR